MRVLVSGGAGFVMSNVVRTLLSEDAEARVVVVDLSGWDEAATEFFAPFERRIDWVSGDIRDAAVLDRAFSLGEVTHVVHGAMVAHYEPWEREDPARFIDVNVMGTVRVLERARRSAGLRRFVYVSTGDVYGEPVPEGPVENQPETGPFNPPELYAISKFASEQVSRRYGELFGLDVVRVRLSAIFGPMERPTGSRVLMSPLYRMVRAYLERRPVRVTRATLQAGGDFLSSEEVSAALATLLRAPRCAHETYNIAAGQFQSMPEVFDTFRTVAPEFEFEVTDESRAEITRYPERRLARWNAYAIDRIRDDVGWLPRPLADQMARYLHWVQANPESRCPRLA